jgi:hypothetical protein
MEPTQTLKPIQADRDAAGKFWDGNRLDEFLRLTDAFARHRIEHTRADSNRELVEDAAKWRSLMACQRMRVIGRTLDNNHIGMEFWREHEAAHPCAKFPQDDCREKFEAFASAALEKVGLLNPEDQSNEPDGQRVS